MDEAVETVIDSLSGSPGTLAGSTTTPALVVLRALTNIMYSARPGKPQTFPIGPDSRMVHRPRCPGWRRFMPYRIVERVLERVVQSGARLINTS